MLKWEESFGIRNIHMAKVTLNDSNFTQDVIVTIRVVGCNCKKLN